MRIAPTVLALASLSLLAACGVRQPERTTGGAAAGAGTGAAVGALAGPPGMAAGAAIGAAAGGGHRRGHLAQRGQSRRAAVEGS